MAIAHDNDQSVIATTGTEHETPAWTPSGSNLILMAGIAWSGWNSSNRFTEARWGGSTGDLLTKIGSVAVSGNECCCQLAYRANPTVASRTLYLKMQTAQDIMYACGATFSGVDVDGTPLGTENSATGSGATASVAVTTVADDEVFDIVHYTYDTDISVGSGQTQLEQRSGGGGCAANSHETATGTSTTMSWTNGDDIWAIYGVGMKPYVAAAGQPTMRRWGGIPGMQQYSGRRSW